MTCQVYLLSAGISDVNKATCAELEAALPKLTAKYSELICQVGQRPLSVEGQTRSNPAADAKALLEQITQIRKICQDLKSEGAFSAVTIPGDPCAGDCPVPAHESGCMCSSCTAGRVAGSGSKIYG